MMTDFDKILGTTNESAPTPKASKAKKAATPKAVTPELEEYLNPVPGAPEIDGLLPGQKGYDYRQGVTVLQTKVSEVSKHLEELRAASRELQIVRNTRSKPLSDYEGHLALIRTQDRINAEANEKQAKIAAVLREMGLS
jgi:hypothetical protein